jgi:hypothetical protein
LNVQGFRSGQAHPNEKALVKGSKLLSFASAFFMHLNAKASFENDYLETGFMLSCFHQVSMSGCVFEFHQLERVQAL